MRHVGLHGVVTVAEQSLVETGVVDEARGTLKRVRTLLIETARSQIDSMTQVIAGVKVRILHHDISAVTGESTAGLHAGRSAALAEQALRFVVLDRKLTQGTRGEKGQRWCERIWSVVQTCCQQQRSAYTFIAEAVRAHFMGQTCPVLL